MGAGVWKSAIAAILLAVLWATPSLAATTYSYDALGRISTATYDNGIEIIYSYDAAGNRTSVVRQLNHLPPVAQNDSVSTGENTPVTFDPRVNDSDPAGTVQR